jgi:PAS domain S-box-containing protein
METINPQFEKELEMLRQRLEEAEDVRRAITHGEVDAFVIGPGGNGRVLLLANAYQRYRQVVERMQQGVVTATPGGQILFANQRFADMIGVPLAQLYTAPLETYVTLTDRARVSQFILLSTRDSRVEVDLSRRDGTTIPVQMETASFADGYATLLVTDLRPNQWPTFARDALQSIRSSLEKLDQPAARDIRAQVEGLARMIDEMVDVNPGR